MKLVETVQPGRFTFKCDSTSLDFIGTLKSRRESQPVELLNSPEDAAVWFREAGIVDDDLDLSAEELHRALDLRAAVASVVDAKLAGDAYPRTALATLNAAAEHPDPVPQLAQHGRRVTATADSALSAIAREAIALLTGASAVDIKECSRDGCNQVYVDRSRGGRREWCAMDPCGNRIKAREYRARKAAANAS